MLKSHAVSLRLASTTPLLLQCKSHPLELFISEIVAVNNLNGDDLHQTIAYAQINRILHWNSEKSNLKIRRFHKVKHYLLLLVVFFR